MHVVEAGTDPEAGPVLGAAGRGSAYGQGSRMSASMMPKGRRHSIHYDAVARREQRHESAEQVALHPADGVPGTVFPHVRRKHTVLAEDGRDVRMQLLAQVPLGHVAQLLPRPNRVVRDIEGELRRRQLGPRSGCRYSVRDQPPYGLPQQTKRCPGLCS